MENLQRSLDQSEQTVTFLREQIAILTALAAQKNELNEEHEIKRITKENELLGKELMKLKQNLQYYEVQNGVEQVEIPQGITNAVLKSNVLETKAIEKECIGENAKESNKEKKAGKDGNKNKSQQAPVEGAKEVDVSQLNMKIGLIVNVKKHPDADALYVEEVNVGEEKQNYCEWIGQALHS